MKRTRVLDCRMEAGSSFSIAVLLSLTSLMFGCNSSSDGPPPVLTALTVQGSATAMYPQFNEKIRHYGVRCKPSDVLMLTATAENSFIQVSIDGRPPEPGSATIELVNPSPNQDIVVETSRGNSLEQYTLHCLADDFPEIEVLRADPEASADLMLVAPRFRENGDRKSYLIVLDNNGVPRFQRKIEAAVIDFKRHPNGLYSYALAQGANQFGISDFVIVILDENLDEIDRLTTVGLTQTDNHDFIFTDEGNSIFISYNSTIRDMSAFGLATDEVVGDSVIQEVTPDGQVVFEWDSWDHIDLADCLASGFPRFPSDYAHLNSVDLTPDGDLIASFRGCAQVLKIDRPSGDVIWRLGGSMSDFEIVGDPFNEFCGQHTALEVSADEVLMFDNGSYCLGDREASFGQFSRIVKYQLDLASGQANFVRDYSLNGTFQEFTRSQGSVQQLANGNWLISWGNGPDASISEVDPSGNEVFAMNILVDGSIAVTYRVFREPSLSSD